MQTGGPGHAARASQPAHRTAWLYTPMKNCKLCHLSRVCNDLPWVCLLIPYLTVAVVAVALGWLFITQEMLA